MRGGGDEAEICATNVMSAFPLKTDMCSARAHVG